MVGRAGLGAPNARTDRGDRHAGEASRERVCLGVIAGAHGLAGEVWIKSFTARAEDIAAYGPLVDESGGRRLCLTLTGRGRPGLSARITGVGDRTAAEALRGLRLYVARAALPAPDEDAFYHVDLIGLRVDVAQDGAATGDRPWGRVVDVLDYGAGPILEIADDDGAGGSMLVQFSRAAVPVVDLAGGRLVIAETAIASAAGGAAAAGAREVA